MREMWLEKQREHKRVLKLSFSDTRPDIHNTKFYNHDTKYIYLFVLPTYYYQLAYFVLALNAFTFKPKTNYVNPPNKLIVIKFITHTLPMFNNKSFLDFIDKTWWQIDNKNKKTQNKELQTHKNIYDHIW